MTLYNPPVSATPTTGLIQSVRTTLTVDTTTTSTSFVTLLTASITTIGSSWLLIMANFSTTDSSSNDSGNQFRITVGGTVYAYAGQPTSVGTVTAQVGARCIYTAALTANTYVVNLDWLTLDATNTISCRPATHAEGASLVIYEVTL